MTQLEHARNRTVTTEINAVAQKEGVSQELIMEEVATGRLVIPANIRHLPPHGQLSPIGIGRAVTTKINANLGVSTLASSLQEESKKLCCAIRYGADTVMDLSTGSESNEIRQQLIRISACPFGTVPMYEMIADKCLEDLTYKDILDVITRQAEQGVDFFTIHAGLLREHLQLIPRRKLGIVSRGGALLAKWMAYHGRQNPMYELFDEISAIMREFDVTFSLGDGLRPGCLADASDEAQFAELKTLGELVQRARSNGCQVMVEGPGHIPFDQIAMNMQKEAELCDNAPFYVLGPLVTDAFPGYDHITSAIGATAAAYSGASFLCYVTPREHLGLPHLEDVKQGCIAYKIAAHAADIARGLPGARDRDDRISEARATLDWEKQFEFAFDPETARALRHEDLKEDSDFCSMCGKEWCAVRLSGDLKAHLL